MECLHVVVVEIPQVVIQLFCIWVFIHCTKNQISASRSEYRPTIGRGIRMLSDLNLFIASLLEGVLRCVPADLRLCWTGEMQSTWIPNICIKEQLSARLRTDHDYLANHCLAKKC